MCLSRQRHDLVALQQLRGFQNLDLQVRELITSLSQGEKKFEELRIVLRDENIQTRDHVDKVFEQQQAQQTKDRHREQFLDSLWFAEINSREERITDAHQKTFEWIFDKSGQSSGPWDNFAQWLENGRDAYWINGKVGSGQSTLMSFLCQDDRTKDSLKVWSKDKILLMPKFFFWSGGTLMEKRIEGLLRSLIWQMLKALSDLDLGFLQTIAAWTERRILTTLRSIVQQISNTHRLCFFIDGLYEYEGEQDELISFIRELMQGANVKVCLSSRPEKTFKKAFGSSTKLRLQDLTRNDIRRFLIKKLQSKERATYTSQDPFWLDHLIKEILERAAEVFFWVSLAVKDQMHGLRNGDSPLQLAERLHSLPNEIEGVYAYMLGRIETHYRKEASQFLQIALAQFERGCSLDFALASRGRLDDMLLSPNGIPELELIALSSSIRESIGITCAGLLEIHNDGSLKSFGLQDTPGGTGREETEAQIFALEF